MKKPVSVTIAILLGILVLITFAFLGGCLTAWFTKPDPPYFGVDGTYNLDGDLNVEFVDIIKGDQYHTLIIKWRNNIVADVGQKALIPGTHQFRVYAISMRGETTESIMRPVFKVGDEWLPSCAEDYEYKFPAESVGVMELKVEPQKLYDRVQLMFFGVAVTLEVK